MHVHKRIDLLLLEQEMATASVPITGIVLIGTDVDDPLEQDVLQGGPSGLPIELPPEAIPVVDAHVAPPLITEFAGLHTVDTIVVTTTDQPQEVFRFHTIPMHIYRATFRMTAVDSQTQTTRDTEARMVFRRTQTTLIQVGTTAILTNFAEPPTTAWTITPTVEGTDLVISVKGSVGRTVDWLLVGEIGVYAPGGLG